MRCCGKKLKLCLYYSGCSSSCSLIKKRKLLCLESTEFLTSSLTDGPNSAKGLEEVQLLWRICTKRTKRGDVTSLNWMLSNNERHVAENHWTFFMIEVPGRLKHHVIFILCVDQSDTLPYIHLKENHLLPVAFISSRPFLFFPRSLCRLVPMDGRK